MVDFPPSFLASLELVDVIRTYAETRGSPRQGFFHQTRHRIPLHRQVGRFQVLLINWSPPSLQDTEKPFPVPAAVPDFGHRRVYYKYASDGRALLPPPPASLPLTPTNLAWPTGTDSRWTVLTGWCGRAGICAYFTSGYRARRTEAQTTAFVVSVTERVCLATAWGLGQGTERRDSTY